VKKKDMAYIPPLRLSCCLTGATAIVEKRGHTECDAKNSHRGKKNERAERPHPFRTKDAQKSVGSLHDLDAIGVGLFSGELKVGASKISWHVYLNPRADKRRERMAISEGHRPNQQRTKRLQIRVEEQVPIETRQRMPRIDSSESTWQ